MATNNIDQGEWHTVECAGQQYTIPKRYQNPAHRGSGAFGTVIRATDTVTGKNVAIKKMLRPFQTPIHAKRTYRELKLLIHLNHPDAQVVQLYNVFTPEKTLDDFETLYFVFNFVDYDLNKVIGRQKLFPENHIRQIIYSLLRGLKFIHSAGILHRDIKPVNIGMDRNSNITILDFGLARALTDGELTTYVATRWWRAPEVYINQRQYREQLDIWSVGCVMAELILLRPVFRGLDQSDQLNKTFEVLGMPDSKTLSAICTPEASTYIQQLPRRDRQDFNKLFGFRYDGGSQTPTFGISPQGVQFLERLLSFDPRQRPTAEQALADPFMASLHDPTEEPTINPVIDENEDANHSISEWKSIIWEMMQNFQPPAWTTRNFDEDN